MIMSLSSSSFRAIFVALLARMVSSSPSDVAVDTNVLDAVTASGYTVFGTLLEMAGSGSGYNPIEEFARQTQHDYAVLAPKDRAFVPLKRNRYLGRLMIPSYKMHLYSFVTNHVTDGTTFAHLQSLPSSLDNVLLLQTMCDGDIYMYTMDGSTDNALRLDTVSNESPAKLQSNDALISDDNFDVYGLDRVLLPDWYHVNLFHALGDYDGSDLSSSYTIFCSLLVSAHMEEHLIDARDMTLFVPVNSGIPDELVEDLLENESALVEFVQYHIATRIVIVRDLTEPIRVMTESRDCLKLVPTGKHGVVVNQHSQITAYELAQYGIFYKMTEALIPPKWR